MTDYTTLGFDQFLNRTAEQTGRDYTEDEVATLISRISGSSLISGISQSPDKKLTMNWEGTEMTASDGARYRVRMGNLEGTAKYGIRIADGKGNIRLEFSDSLQQFTMYDDSDNKIIQVDEDGFHGYNTSGNELVKVDNVGFHTYNTAGTKLVKISSSGAEFYGSSAINFLPTTEAPFGLGYIGSDATYGLNINAVTEGGQGKMTITSGSGGMTITTITSPMVFSNTIGPFYFKHGTTTKVTIDSPTGDITTVGDLTAVDGRFTGNLTVLGTFTGTVSNANYATTAGRATYADSIFGITGVTGGVSFNDAWGNFGTLFFYEGICTTNTFP